MKINHFKFFSFLSILDIRGALGQEQSKSNLEQGTKPTRSLRRKVKKGANECTFEAKLGHPYDDPDDAPYKGYHSDWLMIQRNEGNEYADYCWSINKTDTNWCTYDNTGDSDSAYIGNVDDYYTDWAEAEDRLYNSTFTVKHAAGHTFYLTVSHWYFEKDYYSEYESWSDHMMAAVLTVEKKVQSGNRMLSPKSGWSHPVDLKVKTHIKKGKTFIPNPDYQGVFSVTVSCSTECDCEAGNYKVD